MYVYLSLYDLKFKLCSTKKHSSFGSLDTGQFIILKQKRSALIAKKTEKLF